MEQEGFCRCGGDAYRGRLQGEVARANGETGSHAPAGTTATNNGTRFLLRSLDPLSLLWCAIEVCTKYAVAYYQTLKLFRVWFPRELEHVTVPSEKVAVETTSLCWPSPVRLQFACGDTVWPYPIYALER